MLVLKKHPIIKNYNSYIYNNKHIKDMDQEFLKNVEKRPGIYFYDPSVNEQFDSLEEKNQHNTTNNNYYNYNNSMFGLKTNKDLCYHIPKILGKDFTPLKIIENEKLNWNYSNFIKFTTSQLNKIFPKTKNWLEPSNCRIIIEKMFLGDVYNEQNWYRLIAINNFINSKTEYKNFEEFCQKNKNEIYEDVEKLDLKNNNYSKQLIEFYFKSPLFVEESSYKKAEKLINSLTKNDFIIILKNPAKFTNINETTSNKNIQKMISMIDAEKEGITEKHLEKQLKKIYNKIQKNDTKLFEKYINETNDTNISKNVHNTFLKVSEFFHMDKEYYTMRDFIFSNDPKAKNNILKNLQNISDEINSLNLIALLIACSINNSAFRSTNRQDALTTVDLALTTKDAVNFTKVITEIIFDYTGPLATHTEWKQAMNTKEQTNFIDYDIEASLFITLLAKRDNMKNVPQYIKKAIRPTLQEFYRFTINDSDNDNI